MMPRVELPPATPFTAHVYVFPVTDGVNCCDEPARSDALLGESVNGSAAGDVGGVYPAGASEQLDNIVANVKTPVARIARRNGAPKTD